MKTRLSLTLAVMVIATTAFASLSEAEYCIEVKDSSEKKVEKADTKEGAIENKVSVKRLNNEPGKYLVTSNEENINMITINIVNADGIVILNESHLTNGSFSKVYNLVSKSHYTFTVSDDLGETSTFKF